MRPLRLELAHLSSSAFDVRFLLRARNLRHQLQEHKVTLVKTLSRDDPTKWRTMDLQDGVSMSEMKEEHIDVYFI